MHGWYGHDAGPTGGRLLLLSGTHPRLQVCVCVCVCVYNIRIYMYVILTLVGTSQGLGLRVY
jgi:hypothetical protein